MRRWLSSATVLALLLCINGDVRVRRENHKWLENCKEDSVCLIFGNAKCDYGGKKWEDLYEGKNDGDIFHGYVWENIFKTRCKSGYNNYGYVYAKLDIHPINLTRWRIIATLYHTQTSVEVNKPEDFTFKFGNKAELTFTDNSTKFSWEKKKGRSDSENSLEEKDRLKSVDSWPVFFFDWFPDIRVSYEHAFVQYSTEIATKGEKLIDLIGPEVTCFVKGRKDNKDKTYVMKDDAFPEKLNKLTKCDAAEINEVCYGTCEKIFSEPKSNSNSTNSTGTQDFREPNCPSHLWFHSPSDGAMFRQWKKVEGKLNCYMGWWRPNWTSWDADAPKGSQNLVRTDEVQCSVEKPSKLTTMAQIIFGVSGSILGLLVVAGVVAFVVCFLKRRNSRTHHRHGRTEKTDRKNTIRDSDSRAQTPGTPGGKSTEREKY